MKLEDASPVQAVDVPPGNHPSAQAVSIQAIPISSTAALLG